MSETEVLGCCRGDGSGVFEIAEPLPGFIPMEGRKHTVGAVTAAGKVPLTAQVVIGVASITARQLAGLEVGDTIRTRSEWPPSAILRVGGIDYASGELLDADGNIGVLICKVRGK